MNDENDDEDLAIRMMCGDEDALREVLDRYLESVRLLLIGTYNTTVQESDIEDAINLAIFRMWKSAGSYDKNVATLRAWFYVIAQRAVIDVFRRELRHRKKHPLIDEGQEFSIQCDLESSEPLSKEEKKKYKELEYIVEHKLKGHQKVIIQADLLVGGFADAGSLAEKLNTSKESIYVSRYKAHKKIHKEMTQRAQDRERLRGKK